MKGSGGAPEGGEETKSLQIKPGNTVNGNIANKETESSTLNKKKTKKTQNPLKCRHTENKLDTKDHQSRQQKQMKGQRENEN